MARVSFYVDGFNLYHSLLGHPKTAECRWLDIRQMLGSLLKTTDTLTSVTYFTSLVDWAPPKVKRQQALIRALTNSGVKVVRGRFQETLRECEGACKQFYKAHEEKETDVNIATRLLTDAAEDVFDWAYLVTGDSDQVPTVHALRRVAPEKKICCVFPFRRHSAELKSIADHNVQLAVSHYTNNRFPPTITLPGGGTIDCPTEWLWKGAVAAGAVPAAAAAPPAPPAGQANP